MKDRFRSSQIRDRLRVEADRARDEHDEDRAKFQMVMNHKDRAWMAEVLDRTDDEEEQALILGIEEWLAARPTRTIFVGFRYLIEDFVAALDRGAPVSARRPYARPVADKFRRIVEAQKAHDDRLPSWMKDPKLLPKRPPPSAPRGDD